MNKILVSSALTLSAFFLLAGASAKAQDFFFNSAYDRPVETVFGLHVGTRVDSVPAFAPAPAGAAQTSAPAVAAQTPAVAAHGRRQVAHAHQIVRVR